MCFFNVFCCLSCFDLDFDFCLSFVFLFFVLLFIVLFYYISFLFFFPSCPFPLCSVSFIFCLFCSFTCCLSFPSKKGVIPEAQPILGEQPL